MSYSRWSNSRWYTYWLSQPDSFGENRLNATFEICDIIENFNFTAQDLRTKREECLAKVQAINQDATPEEMEELSGYMDEFLKDVDKEYPKNEKHKKKKQK